MELLDSLMRTKDYSLDVAVVDMSETEEIAANVALNNSSAMGEFDYEAIKSLASDYSLDLQADFLFDRDDLLVSFGLDLGEAAVQKRDATTTPELMQEIKDRKKLVRDRFNAVRAEEGDYTTSAVPGVMTVVFTTESSRKAFCERVGVPIDTTVISAVDAGIETSEG